MKLNKKYMIIVGAALVAVIIAIVAVATIGGGNDEANPEITAEPQQEKVKAITDGKYYGYNGWSFYMVTLKDNQYTFESGTVVGQGSYQLNEHGSLLLSDGRGTLNPNYNGYEHVKGSYDCQYYYVAPGLYYSDDNLLKRNNTARASFLYLNEDDNTYQINYVGTSGRTFNYDPEAEEQYVSVIDSSVRNDFVLHIKDGSVTQYVCNGVHPLRNPLENGIDDDYYREVTSDMKNTLGQPFTGLFDEHYEDMRITYADNVTTLIGDGKEVVRMVVSAEELRFEYPQGGKTLVFYADEAKAHEARN